MTWRDVALELDAEGPRFSWKPLRAEPDVVEAAEALRKSLQIDVRVAPLAKFGIPAPDDMEPSSMQREIRVAHEGLLAKRAKRARRRLAGYATEVTRLAQDMTDSRFEQLLASERARLGEVAAAFTPGIRPLIQQKIDAEADLIAFETVNRTEDQATAHSIVEFIGSTVLTAAVESLINGFLFKEQLGLYAALGFSVGVGAALGVVGAVIGIGWAGLRRREKKRRLFSGAMVALGGALALFLLFVFAYYRAGLLGAPAAAGGAGGVNWHSLFFNAPVLVFTAINVAGLWVIADKAAKMFGWRDLARRRRAVDRAQRESQDGLDEALGACDEVKDEAVEERKELARRAEENVGAAHALGVKSGETLDDMAIWNKGVAEAYVACELYYRELVMTVHPAHTYQPRFADPPKPLVAEAVAPDPNMAAMIVAIEARALSVRERDAEVETEIYAMADAVRTEIAELHVRIEAELRIHGRAHLRVVR